MLPWLAVTLLWYNLNCDLNAYLGPLLVNVFMSSIEEKISDVEDKLPPYYRRYVDDTLTTMPDLLKGLALHPQPHPPRHWVHYGGRKGWMFPVLGIQLLHQAPRIKTIVSVKPTNSGLLLHHHSPVLDPLSCHATPGREAPLSPRRCVSWEGVQNWTTDTRGWFQVTFAIAFRCWKLKVWLSR